MNIDVEKLITVGQNVQAATVDGKLILVIDTTRNIGLSSIGKMMGIGSTGGFVPVGDLKLNLYLGKKFTG